MVSGGGTDGWGEVGVAAVVVVLLTLLAALSFPRFRYSIEGQFLVVRRYALHWIPVGSYWIELDDVRRIEYADAWGVPAGYLNLGHRFSFGGVFLTLRRPRMLFFQGVRLTPRHIDAFVDELAACTKADDAPVQVEHRPFVDRVPVSVLDALATLSVLGVLTMAMALTAYALVPGLREARASSPAYVILLAGGGVLAELIGVLMWYDCLWQAAVNEDDVFRIQAVGVLFLPPLAWAYYLLDWRPRHVAP